LSIMPQLPALTPTAFPYTTLFRSDLPGLQATLEADFGLAVDLAGWAASQPEIDAERIQEHVQRLVADLFARKEASLGAQTMRLRSEEHTSELQSRENLVCRLLLEK